MRAWLRRSWTLPAEALDDLHAGGLQLDPARRALVTAGGAVVPLTNLELPVLHVLMGHRSRVLDANFIMDRVWGFSGEGDGILLKNVV